jgi:capsular polysaccharide biosynthesis protein
VDVWGAITVLVRRYYLTVPIIAIALVLGWVYANKTPAEYHASAAVVVIGPAAAVSKDVPQPVNPYTTVGTATVLATIQIDAGSEQSLQQLQRAGLSTNFTVVQNGKTPIIDITATSRSPQQALATTTRLISIIQADLETRQHPYAPNKANQITAPVLSPSVLGALDKSAKKKALTVAIGLGIVFGIMLTLIIDGILRARQRRRDTQTDWAAPVLDREPADNRTAVVKP